MTTRTRKRALTRWIPERALTVLRRLRFYWTLLQIQEFSFSKGRCPFCGPTVFLRLNARDEGVRCAQCTASIVHLSVGCMIRDAAADLSGLDVCEFSASGPLVEFLERSARHADFSEYSDEAEHGSSTAGVRNEDVQRLTYPDDSFDLITHSEVMEHVPDDAAAFRELRRVLRSSGCMIFTVPLSAAAITVERARLGPQGQVEHLLEPVYHTDPWRTGQGILAFRDYGEDILDRLNAAGFSDVVVRQPTLSISWVTLRYVVVARA